MDIYYNSKGEIKRIEFGETESVLLRACIDAFGKEGLIRFIFAMKEQGRATEHHENESSN